MELNTLHLCMELTAAGCLFFIAWLNLHYRATGEYSGLMAMGTTIAGIADLSHVLVPIFYPNMAEYWTMMSWGVSRITLIIMFLMVFLCCDVIRCKLKTLAIILSTPLIFSIFMAAFATFGVDGFHLESHAIDIFGTVVKCPFDFVLLVLWLITAIILRKKAHILFPPHVYWLFMSQGIMVHAIMSFNLYSGLDMPSILAHGLKISEYYTFILIYLLYKSALDRRASDFRTSTINSINTTCSAPLDALKPIKENE